MTRWNERSADSVLHEVYHSSAKWNESYYKSSDFDTNLASARAELNFNKRRSAYRNAQKTLWEESGTMIPYHVSKLVVTNSRVKNKYGSEALNEDNLVCKAIRYIKKRYKNQIGIMCDVALDPYTSHGHDGLLKSGYVLNDETIEV